MGKTNGPVSPPCCTASLPNSAKPDGALLGFSKFFTTFWTSLTWLHVFMNLLTLIWMNLFDLDNDEIDSLCCCVQVRVVGPKHQKNRVVQRGGGEAASLSQADAHSVEDHRSHHWTHCCPVSGALWIPAVCVNVFRWTCSLHTLSLMNEDVYCSQVWDSC